MSEALERCRLAKLVDNSKQRINILALKEFLIHGLKYVFPVQPQSKARGVATAVSAPPLCDKIMSGKEVYIWPYAKGNVRGESIKPLYHTVPMAVQNDPTLHALLAIADVFRIGRAREIETAKDELYSILSHYDIR